MLRQLEFEVWHAGQKLASQMGKESTFCRYLQKTPLKSLNDSMYTCGVKSHETGQRRAGREGVITGELRLKVHAEQEAFAFPPAGVERHH